MRLIEHISSHGKISFHGKTSLPTFAVLQSKINMALIIWYRHVIVLHKLISPGQNDRNFADDIFRGIFANEKICILVKISTKFVPGGAIDNNPVLV